MPEKTEYEITYERVVRQEVYDAYLTLCRVPSISSEPRHHADVRAANRMIAGLLDQLNLFDTIVEYDYGDPAGPTSLIARRAPREGPGEGKPTLGLYAHSDVQPATAQGWRTHDPFDAELVGERLYGRGVVDDKAGVFAVLAAVRLLASPLRESGCGLVVLIEGEEECGSPRARMLFDDMAEHIRADEFIIMDAANVDDHTPALTTTIRGNLVLRVGVRTLARRVHSGGSGGVLPDAVAVASKIIAGLYDERGVYRITPGPVGVPRHVVPEPLSKNALAALHGHTRAIAGDDPVAASWYGYSATVIGMDVSPVDASSNTLLDAVSFLLSVRIPPGGAAAAALGDLRSYLGADTWFGSEVTVSIESRSDPYSADPTTPRASLLRTSVARVWGSQPALIGIGGSIPIVASLTEAMPACEVLLFGVGTTSSRAHSTDESLEPALLDRISLSLTRYLHARICEPDPIRYEEER